MKTIVFDFDGVILDSFDTVLKELGNLHQKFNLPTLTREILSELFDGNFWENHKALGLNEEDENKLKGELKEALARTQSEMPFFDGIKEVLEELATRFELIILSSNHAENIKNRLEKEGLQDSFNEVSGTETIGNKSEKLQKIMDITEDSIIFITDTKGDLMEAKDLEITRVGVTWGYHSKERLLIANPTTIIDKPKELLEIVANI